MSAKKKKSQVELAAHLGKKIFGETTFTKEEQHVINTAALRVWDEIGDELLLLVAQEGETSIPRAEVIELVCDADRLEQAIKDKALAKRVRKATLETLTPILEQVFRAQRYGA